MNSRDVLDAIEVLLNEKRAGAELDRGPHSPAISAFIQSELARLEGIADAQPVSHISADRLDECFRQILSDVWGKKFE